VLVAVLRDDLGELAELYEAIERACEGLGFPREERAFKAHATLARFRTSVDLRPFLTGMPPAGPVPLTAVSLYESVLAPGGAQYSVLERYSLAAKPDE
jgi:2'-5' RNA ligase